MLRIFLIKLGCKSFQESVFITPYNPRELLNKFIKLNNIPGMIIASDMGENGGIGEITLIDMLAKIYNLKNINEKYNLFLDKVRKSKPNSLILLEYLSILKDDPQLPFNLLPNWWLGNKAHQKYEKIKLFYDASGRAGDRKI